MADSPQKVRIFISSPGDVSEERDGARRVVDGLRRLYPGAELETVLWEDLALPATASFQETIDFLLERKPIDIAVLILWSRLGSPLGAAITKADGSPYRSGTEREFELMLTAFEQSGRQRPITLAYMRDDDAAFRELLTSCPDDKLENMIQQRRLVESFVREQFHDAEGHNIRAYQTYREPIGFREQLKGHLRRALDDVLEVEQAATWTEDPYRGLETFDIEHAPIFYGRDKETCDLLQRLRDQQRDGCAFAVIVAASGSGKSSLARAGVAANLVQGGDNEATGWKVRSFIPALAERSLCHTLARTLADVLPALVSSADSVERIAKGLGENASLTVGLTIGPAFEQTDKPFRLLLIVDQMEELWTDRNTTEEDREQFLDAITALSKSGHVSVLATLRSDFYSHAQRSPTFLKLKGDRGHYDLLPPDAASIHRLITEPARLAGLGFERNEKTGKSLDEVIWEDASNAADALPLLEYTLSELYRQRDEKRQLMTYAAYVDLGGVEGAIGKRADETFESLPADAQAALDEILPRLVSVDAAGEQSGVRRRASLADLTATPARSTLTERLIADRFLTTDREGETAVASFAHEALLRSWDRIVNWINVNREQLRLRARVEQSQQRWEQQSQDESLLLAAGLPLDEGRQLIDEAPYLLSDSTTDYIYTSIDHHEQNARKSRRVRTAVLSTVAVLLTAIVIGAAILVVVQNRANRQLQASNAALKQSYQRETARFELARQAIGLYHGDVSQDLLLKQAQFKQLRQRLLQGAADFYKQLEALLKEQTDSQSQAMLGQSYYELGQLMSAIGDKQQALDVHQKGLQVRLRLARADDAAGKDAFGPTSTDVPAALSSHADNVQLDVLHSMGSVADLQNQLGDFDASEKTYLEAIKQGERLRHTADDADPLLSSLGTLYNQLGGVVSRNGQLDRALDLYGRAVTVLQAVVDRNPDDQHAQRELAYGHNNIGAIYSKTGRPQQALAEFEKTLQVRQQLLEQGPDDPNLKRDLAIAYGNIGYAYMSLNASQASLQAMREALKIRQDLVGTNPAVTEFRTDLARSHDDIGYHYLQIGESTKSQKEFARAAEIQRSVVEDNPDVVEFRGHLARFYNNLGSARARTDMKAALPEFQNALQVQREIVKRFPTLTRYQSELAQSVQNVGLVMRFNGDFDGAVEHYREAIAILEKLAADNPTVPQYQLDISGNLQNIAVVKNLEQQFEPAIEALRRAIAIQLELTEKNPLNGDFARELGRSHNTRADTYHSAGQLDEARSDYERSLQIHERLVADDAENYEFRHGLAFTLSGLARVLRKLDLPAEAAMRLQAAIEHRGRLPSLSPGARFDLAGNHGLLALLAKDAASGVTQEDAARHLESALDSLKQAIAAGYSDLEELESDERFTLLRDNAEFQQLLERQSQQGK